MLSAADANIFNTLRTYLMTQPSADWCVKERLHFAAKLREPREFNEGNMKLPADEIFHEVCADVVVRFKGHDAYKGRSGALRAFRKRAPGYDSPVYESAFDSCCDIYDLAVIAIELFPATREKKSKYAESEDIDYARCMQHIDCVFPGDGESIKKQILNWVIFWHYLK